MNSSSRLSPQLIAKVIENYLAAHPGAADNLQGIISCWLPPEYRHVSPEVAEQAVDMLCNRGILRAEPHLAGQVVFRRPPRDPTDDTS
ncbi:hypothetical protein [Ectothiorhodospira lacustris]|uniref:hypothetical protein n=1 Tax=Ectothiorhodospira lacustris TaxID=2899127 RepID=UPI001EE81D9B|nr:hypothetical protein [Ectothiorhodospira lacustris]MCG5508751.1 hypothetical protein [Ectothiorhodospira lacustris]MCG5520542.1 hypothetical protein [Ectothiorhodospira lacustris]